MRFDEGYIVQLRPSCSGKLFLQGLILAVHKLDNSGDLNTELVCYLNGPKEVGCQMVWFLKAI